MEDKDVLRDRLAQARAMRIDFSQKNPVEKQKEDPASLRKAINAFCWVCVGENKKEVTNCTAKNCPLWLVRPWQKEC